MILQNRKLDKLINRGVAQTFIIKILIFIMEILFLGTGGGRFTTIKQLRKTGGMILKGKKFLMHIDPGPGALINAIENGINHRNVKYLLVTHGHTDQANDVRVIIEAMTDGCTHKRGILIASKSVLYGYEDEEIKIERWISDYHEKSLEKVIQLKDKEVIRTEDFELIPIRVKHNDPETYGFKINADGEKIGFITDSEFFPELIEFFKDCRYLVINCLRPHNVKWKGHMTTEDALKIIEDVEPEMAVLQHFGMAMIKASISKEEKWLKNKYKGNCEIIFARDYQRINFRKEINLLRFK